MPLLIIGLLIVAGVVLFAMYLRPAGSAVPDDPLKDIQHQLANLSTEWGHFVSWLGSPVGLLIVGLICIGVVILFVLRSNQGH